MTTRRVRYVKSPAEVDAARAAQGAALTSHIQSLRCVYATDPALTAAVVPPPLVADPAGEVGITISTVTVDLGGGATFSLGSGVIGVRARRDDVEGFYLVTMPMTVEQAVLSGRDRYGEPKKMAEIALAKDGEQVRGTLARMGMTYVTIEGTVGAERGARDHLERGFCFKVLPACDPGRDFDGDPLLVELTWKQRHTSVRAVDGTVWLGDSPFDPIADLPVERIVRLEWDEGTAESDGRVIGPVDGAALLPYLHQRYDDPMTMGLEVP